MAVFLDKTIMDFVDYPHNTIDDNLIPIYLVKSKTDIIDRRNELPECVKKYWKIVDNFPVEMNQDDKNSKDQEEADALALTQENAKDIDNLENSVKTLAKLAFKEINKLRVLAGQSEYTWNQFKISFKNEWI